MAGDPRIPSLSQTETREEECSVTLVKIASRGWTYMAEHSLSLRQSWCSALTTEERNCQEHDAISHFLTGNAVCEDSGGVLPARTMKNS